MSRSVKEWIGKSDDTKVPPRVRLRVVERQEGRCSLCSREFTFKNSAEIDHKVPLILGGTNAESNLWALCAVPCHQDKTKSEVKVKAKVARSKMDRVGIKKQTRNPVPGSRMSDWARRYDKETGRWKTVRREKN